MPGLRGMTREPVRRNPRQRRNANRLAILFSKLLGAGLSLDSSGNLTTTAKMIFNEVPAGTVNGVNATFTLANVPVAGTVRVFKNGLLMKPLAGNDYTIASSTITFLTGAIPQTGANLLAHYIKT